MLTTTHTMRVYRHPGADKTEDFPIGEGRARYIRPLELYGTAESPDEFNIEDRIPLEFAGDSDADARKRADAIERDLADAYEELSLIADADTDSPTPTEEEA